MSKLLLLSLFLFTTGLSAQLTLGPTVYAGPAWIADESGDGQGTAHGFGLQLGYDTGKPWGRLLLELSRTDFGGFAASRSFSQVVAAAEPGAPSTIVSLRTVIPRWRAYRVMVAGEWPFKPISPKLRVGGGLGALRLVDEDRRLGDVAEQTLEGQEVPRQFLETFLVRDGIIERVDSRTISTEGLPPVLRRTRLVYNLRLTYDLSDDVSVSLQWESTLGAIGRAYGPGGEETMVGRLDQLRVGVVGHVFGW